MKYFAFRQRGHIDHEYFIKVLFLHINIFISIIKLNTWIYSPSTMLRTYLKNFLQNPINLQFNVN